MRKSNNYDLQYLKYQLRVRQQLRNYTNFNSRRYPSANGLGKIDKFNFPIFISFEGWNYLALFIILLVTRNRDYLPISMNPVECMDLNLQFWSSSINDVKSSLNFLVIIQFAYWLIDNYNR